MCVCVYVCVTPNRIDARISGQWSPKEKRKKSRRFDHFVFVRTSKVLHSTVDSNYWRT